MKIEAEAGKQMPHENRIVDCAAEEHGDDHADALPAHDLFEHAGPFARTAALGEGIEDERFVRAAGHAFGHPAENAVGEAEEQKYNAAVAGGGCEQAHFDDHENGGGNDKWLAANAVGEDACRQIGEDDGERPGEVEQGVLGGAEAEVEKEDGEDGIIKARVEEDAEKDEAPPVAVGIGHSISSIHVAGIWPKLGK